MKDRKLIEAFLALAQAFEDSLIDPKNIGFATGGIVNAKPDEHYQPLSHEAIQVSGVNKDTAYKIARNHLEQSMTARKIGGHTINFVVLSEEEYYKLGLILIEQNELLRTSLAIAKRDGKETYWEGFKNCLDKSLRKQFTFLPQFKCRHCFLPLTTHKCTNVVCNSVFHDERTKS